jgi:tRNA 5-methylaminomethyl-2-thiouridine biosynthesis bifunctional protein
MTVLPPAPYALDADGTPYSPLYDDVYHSAAGAHEQACHVFLAGNSLPARWQGRDHFTILETGFGLGVNFLATWLAWRNDPQACATLHFSSLEKHPFAASDLRCAHLAWPEFAELSHELRASWPELVAGSHEIQFEGGRLVLQLVFGDALAALPSLETLPVDAYYLDGFSPSKNPELWSPQICRALAAHAAPAATLATWSVAGSVRAALTAADFKAEKRPGFAAKRQMLVARHTGAGAARS